MVPILENSSKEASSEEEVEHAQTQRGRGSETQYMETEHEQSVKNVSLCESGNVKYIQNNYEDINQYKVPLIPLNSEKYAHVFPSDSL